MCNLICTRPKSILNYSMIMKYLKKGYGEIIPSKHGNNTNRVFEDTFDSVIAKLLDNGFLSEANASTSQLEEGRHA